MRTDRATHLNFRRELMGRECSRAQAVLLKMSVPTTFLPAMLQIARTEQLHSPIHRPELSKAFEQTCTHLDSLLQQTEISQPRLQRGERFGSITWRSDGLRMWHFMAVFAVGLRRSEAGMWFIGAGQVNNFAHGLEEASFPTMAAMLVESLSAAGDREIPAEHLRA